MRAVGSTCANAQIRVRGPISSVSTMEVGCTEYWRSATGTLLICLPFRLGPVPDPPQSLCGARQVYLSGKFVSLGKNRGPNPAMQPVHREIFSIYREKLTDVFALGNADQ